MSTNRSDYFNILLLIFKLALQKSKEYFKRAALDEVERSENKLMKPVLKGVSPKLKTRKERKSISKIFLL